jgi:hypothetical protein
MAHARPLLISMVLTLTSSLLVGSSAPTSQEPDARTKNGAAVEAKAAAAGKVEVQLLRLSISKPTPRPRAEEGQPIFGMGEKGTSLSLRVALPGRSVIGLDKAATKLMEFADDKGTDLLKPAGDRPDFGDSPISRRVMSESEPHALTLELAGDQPPAPGAVKISVKADVVVLCSGGEKTAEQKDVALKSGTKIAAGPLTFLVGMTEATTDLGEYKFMFVLSADRPFESTIKDFSFIDPAGKPMKSQVIIDFSSTSIEGGSYSRTYVLERMVDKVTMKVTCFDNVVAVHVPVELTTGLGF